MSGLDDAEIEEAADKVLEEIDQHDLSGADVDKEDTKSFWEAIVYGLKTRLDALRSDDE